MILCIPCLGLLLYFIILGVFFPKYRTYVKEGWKCFLDKILARKCSISFDSRIRLALSMWLTKKGSVRLGRFFYNERNFNITLTVITIVLTIVSIYLSILMVQFWVSPPCSADSVCSVNI